MPYEQQISGKTTPIEEQVEKKESELIIEEYEKDIELLYRSIENIDFGENTTVNDFSKEKEIITIREMLNIWEEMREKGFTHEVASSQHQFIVDLVKWSHNVFKSRMKELMFKIDQKARYLEKQLEARELLIQTEEDLLEEAQSKIEQLQSENEELSKDLHDLKKILRYCKAYIEGTDPDEDENRRLDNKINQWFNMAEDIKPHEDPEPKNKIPAQNNKAKSGRFL